MGATQFRKEKHMSEKKMPKAQRQAWLVGQYQLALRLGEAMENNESLEYALAEALDTIRDEARKDDMMGLFMKCLELSIWVRRQAKIKPACQHDKYSASHNDCVEHDGDVNCYQSNCDNCNAMVSHTDI